MNSTLIVEDSETISAEIKKIIVDLGINPILASNGQEGLQKWEEHHDDIFLILCDIHMPVMDGLDMIEDIHQNLGERTLPKILMITTETSQEQKAIAKKLGVTGWILKPFHNDSLKEIITNLKEDSTR